MTQAPNDRTPPPGGTGLPEGVGPIDTGTPVRRPTASGAGTRTVTGRENTAEPVARPSAARAPEHGSPSPHAPGSTGAHAPGSASGTMTPDAAAPVPLAHDVTADPRTASGPSGAGDHADSGPHAGHPLFAPERRDAFAARIQQAVTGFVEDPRRAVRDADATFEEVVADLGAALQERGRKLRAGKGEDDAGAETEDLRIALQHYRDLTERLVRL
ncbi:hypothetical protein [Streptomyces sp. V2I9]|uniref:hypothetical protein n=1 Tax=Streptomyces sp. V2I9 TaxID=3042304 RepID=UPI002783D8D0|nr:hypothetical protein [Streptomyces sp. V2I9]MDQ0982814.1 hypothetical protein [Streptomyces sp. V2I9]